MPETLVKSCGIDVSKSWLDCAFTAQQEQRFPNSPEGFRVIIARARELGARLVLEATGPYHQALLAAACAAGVEVCVVPPGRIRAFARALGLRAKTDRIDAQLLRRYGEQCAPRVWTAPAPERALLRSWLDARHALLEQRVAWENRQTGADRPMQRICREQLRLIDRQVQRLEAQIRAHVEQHPDLRQRAERWQQVCGIGPVTVWTVLAYLPELEEPDATDNEIAALTGLAPDPDESGTCTRRRHIAGGRWQLRCVLHMAARSARQHNRILREFGDRLAARGKPYKVIITAISRKLLLLLRHLALNPHFFPCELNTAAPRKGTFVQ